MSIHKDDGFYAIREGKFLREKVSSTDFPMPTSRRRLIWSDLEDVIVLVEEDKNKRIVSVVDDGAVVGFLVTIEASDYVYGLYLAIRKDLRGNGYGTEIMKTLLEEYSDKTFIFSIETPVEGAPNYEQRVKRERLYMRLGCVRAEYDLDMEGVNYSFMCSKMSDNVIGYIDDFLEEITKLEGRNIFKRKASRGSRFFVGA